MKELKNEVELIQNEDLKIFANKCLEKAPSYFWEIPASSTGKYHPEYSLGKGGLVRHTKAAVKIANDLLRLEMYSLLEEKKDEIIFALIMHDSVKGHPYTTTDHPLKASELIRQTAKEVNYNGDFEFVCSLIESHMGQWNSDFRSGKEILPKPQSIAQKFVHMCDYLASRKFITIDLGE